ncbi:hypothetical protein BKA56DRAFT_621698 [Ilyonectria sp. MPI-CAGE-AT-0026]|nr:hypothetical protein BKA56DRAFT_621698 [Ilyonectria sp. MPI-CAGE-AT-0026]
MRRVQQWRALASVCALEHRRYWPTKPPPGHATQAPLAKPQGGRSECRHNISDFQKTPQGKPRILEEHGWALAVRKGIARYIDCSKLEFSVIPQDLDFEQSIGTLVRQAHCQRRLKDPTCYAVRHRPLPWHGFGKACNKEKPRNNAIQYNPIQYRGTAVLREPWRRASVSLQLYNPCQRLADTLTSVTSGLSVPRHSIHGAKNWNELDVKRLTRKRLQPPMRIEGPLVVRVSRPGRSASSLTAVDAKPLPPPPTSATTRWDIHSRRVWCGIRENHGCSFGLWLSAPKR